MKALRRNIVAVVVTGLVMAGAAAAAWIVYTPAASGSATGTFATPTSVNMISFTTTTGSTPVSPCTAGSGATCTGGTPGVLAVAVKNNDPFASHAASGLTVTLSSATVGCASHLFVTAASGLTQTVAAGATATDGTVSFVADPSTPGTCGGANITATISGTAA